jgi:hypothetical protein
MTKIADKVFIGVGIAWILIGAVSLWTHSRIWGAFSILIGISLILTGISLNPRSVRQKVIRGFSFGFLGAAVVFFGIWLAANVP